MKDHFLFSFALACLLIFLSFVFAPQKPDAEKISAYECGFDPFDDSRNQFDVRFYLVAILFIIFDLETAFLFPFAVVYKNLGYLAVSLGFYKTLFSAPGSSTSSEIPEDEQVDMGLKDGLIRFSIGLDNDIERT